MICAPVVASFVLAFLFSAAPDNQKMDPREVEARKECSAGRYQAGSDLLAQLFAETGNPNYVFNQGRCFEQNGKLDEAILRFREYRRIGKNLSADLKAEAEQHIAECQAGKVRENAEAAGAVQSPAASAAPPTADSQAQKPTTATGDGTDQSSPSVPSSDPAPAAPSQVALPPTPQADSAGSVVQLQDNVSEARKDASGLRLAGIMTGAIGVAALATGVVFSLETRSVRNDITNDNARRSFDRNKYDNGRLYSHLQWVGYGIGGAAVLGGAVLYYLGARDVPSRNGSISIVPTVSTSQATLTLLGSY